MKIATTHWVLVASLFQALAHAPSASGANLRKSPRGPRSPRLLELRVPDCEVEHPEWVGDGLCDSGEERYNTVDCGYDGGDCCEDTCVDGAEFECGTEAPYDCRDPSQLQIHPQYPDCLVENPELIGDGECNPGGSYNAEECGYDGGDCIIPQYPDCHVQNPEWVGDGWCDPGEPYNTEECGYDGGDCCEDTCVDGAEFECGMQAPYDCRDPSQIQHHPQYPDCHVQNPDWVGDGYCDPDEPYNTEECGYDGGDCIVPQYPDCHVQNPGWVGDGWCDGEEPFNTEECGYDGGDCCEDTCVDGFSECGMEAPYVCQDPSQAGN